jgi:hypothetical protein
MSFVDTAVQKSVSSLTALCERLTYGADHNAAVILLAPHTRASLAGRVGVAYPSLEKAQSLPTVAMRAITSLDGQTLGLLIVTSSSPGQDQEALNRDLDHVSGLARLQLSHLALDSDLSGASYAA